MATDLQNSIRNAAERIVQYIDDASSMTVETKYVIVDAAGDIAFDQAKPLARSDMALDGDSDSIVPMRLTEAGRLDLDASLLELHMANVETAIQYHKSALEISREIGDRCGEGSDLGNLGIAYLRLGKVEKAIDAFEQGLSIAREIGDRRLEARLWHT